MIRDAVLHIINEQPLLVDLIDRPGPTDSILACTNLRSLSGTRPVWIDDSSSMFYFPLVLIRFVEIHPGSEGVLGLPPASTVRADAPPRPAQPEPEPELEIDEDFLRRVRDA